MTKDITLGSWGESYAALLYVKRGYRLLARNSFNHTGKQMGEIDLIVLGNNQIVFVEVKTRLSNKFGFPEESISRNKSQKLIKIVNWFLVRHPAYQTYRPRIDVCAIFLNSALASLPSANLDKSVKYAKIITNAVELN